MNYGKYVIAEWNINGFFSTKNSYYTEFKKNVINFLCVDLIIIPEIHCTPDQKIEIENFTVFQLNRPQNINARRGSGGIAIAINNLLLESHEIISVYTHGCDGQIGIKLKNKFNDL